MLDQILAQRAVLEALEAKNGALRASDGLSGNISLDLYLWDDLGQKHPNIFKSASPEEVAAVIVEVERQSKGRFRLVSIKPSMADRDVLRVPYMEASGRITDISNLYWQVRHYEDVREDVVADASVLWLTPRELYATIAGKRRSFSIRPGSKPHRLLEWFSEHREFTKTHELEEALKTTQRTIATEIGKLRKKAARSFGFDGSEFIESSQGEGYRLNKALKIKIERDAA